jgi:hypothetical protein
LRITKIPFAPKRWSWSRIHSWTKKMGSTILELINFPQWSYFGIIFVSIWSYAFLHVAFVTWNKMTHQRWTRFEILFAIYTCVWDCTKHAILTFLVFYISVGFICVKVIWRNMNYPKLWGSHWFLEDVIDK